MLRCTGLAGLFIALACGPTPGQESATATEASGSSTGAGPVCGDGVVDDGEPCDDGNEVQDDGCDACSLPAATEVWSVVFDLPEHQHDYLNAVGFTSTGQVYVAGSQSLQSVRPADLVVRKLDVDGTLLWERVVAGEAGKSDVASALAVTDDGGVVVGGVLDAEPSSGTSWVRRYSAAGDVLWTFASPPLSDWTDVGAVAVAGDAVFVAGYEPGEEGFVRVVVRRLDATDGAGLWQRAHDRESFAAAAALDGGSLVVAGWQTTGGGGNEALVQRWGADGTPSSTWTWSAPDSMSTRSDAVAVLPGGTIALATNAYTDAALDGIFVVGFAGDGTIAWTTRVETDWRSPILRGLAVDASGRLFAAGSAEVAPARGKGILGLFGPGGATLKLENLGGEEILSEFWGVAVHSSGFVVAGMICDHTSCDQWVRKFAPL